MKCIERVYSILFLILLYFPLFAQAPGDALQLLSYRVTPATKPNVMDGQIAASINPTDWREAYVRSMTVGISGNPANGARPLTFLVANDLDSLYIAVAVVLPNASELNRATVYFDQSTRGVLDGSTGVPGEYYVTMLANASAPQDGHWNGTSWALNSIPAVKGRGLRKGALAGSRLYNFEFQMPLRKAADSFNSYLAINAGDEIGFLVKITAVPDNIYYWVQTNAVENNPLATGTNGKTGWGEIQTIGTGIADRNIVSLGARHIIPTIDGNISGDNNWRYSFNKNMILTDFDGNKLNASVKIKERTAPNNLLFGITINNLLPAATDYLAIYFDQGASGGNLNYILTRGGDHIFDIAARILGNSTFQDYNFNAATWVADASAHGSGAATVISGNWEVELAIPMVSGDSRDLNIASGNPIGVLFHFFNSAINRDYWWSATINSNAQIIDPIDPVYNALGWGYLQTGGPFIQPIYPEQGDTLSGEYPLAIYVIDPGDAVPETGIRAVNYEVRKEDPLAGTFTTLLSGTMTKIEDDSIPIWTGTLNTRNILELPSTLLKLVYIVNDGEIDPVAVPIDIYINNQGGAAQLDDPTINIISPTPNAVLSGAGVAINFTAATHQLLFIDTVQIFIDGQLMQTYLPPDTSTYSSVYFWNTSPFPDGRHVIQARAVNSLGLENLSPSVVVTTQNTPSVAITSPSASSLVNSVINVVFTATPVSPSTLAATEISIDGGTWVSVTTQPPVTGGTGNYSWNTNSVLDGTHSLQVRSTDNTGKIGYSVIVKVTVDNTPPTGILTAATSVVKNGDKVIFTYDGSEAGLRATILIAQLRLLDNQAVADLSLTDPTNSGVYNATYTVSTSNTVSDGIKILTATVTDSAMNIYYPQVRVTLDNSPPVFQTVVTLDPDNIYTNGETVSLLATFDAAGYVVTCDFSSLDAAYVRGSEVITDNGNNSYSIRYTISQTNTKPNGTYTILATATDQVGLSATGSIDILLDNSGPVVSNLTLTDPDRILNTSTTIIATLTGDNSNIKAAEYYVDVIGVAGEGISLVATDGNFNSLIENVNATLSIANLSQGKHTLYVRGQNVAGKWGPVAGLDFVVDTKPPNIQVVEVIYPQGQTAARNGQRIIVTALVTDNITGVNPDSVLLTALDVNTTVNNISMYDNGTGGDRVAGDNVYSVEIIVNSGKTGDPFVYSICAQDSVPNKGCLSGTIALDNLPPQLTISVSPQPKNGEVYINQVIVTGTYYDLPDSDNVSTITLVVKNVQGDNINNSPIAIPPNQERRFSAIVTLVEGSNDISVLVTDLSGNMYRQTVNLQYLKPTETLVVDRRGGTVRSSDGTTVIIPPNALLSRTEVSINTVSTAQFPKPSNPNVKLLRNARQFAPNGLVFHQPVSIFLPYTDADLDIDQDGRNDLAEDKLDVFFWDGNVWVKTAAAERSLSNRMVTFVTNHFSTYALGTDVSVGAVTMYWTKNPFLPEEGTTAVIDFQGSGVLTLKVYDLAGNLVRTIARSEAVNGATTRRWNGLNDFDVYVGSGIYVYILEFEDAAGTKTVLKKPIGVIK